MAKSKLVEANKKIEDRVVAGYKKIETAAVDGFENMTGKFVAHYLTKENESLEDAKQRLAKEQEKRLAAQEAIIQENKVKSESHGK